MKLKQRHREELLIITVISCRPTHHRTVPHNCRATCSSSACPSPLSACGSAPDVFLAKLYPCVYTFTRNTHTSAAPRPPFRRKTHSERKIVSTSRSCPAAPLPPALELLLVSHVKKRPRGRERLAHARLGTGGVDIHPFSFLSGVVRGRLKDAPHLPENKDVFVALRSLSGPGL